MIQFIYRLTLMIFVFPLLVFAGDWEAVKDQVLFLPTGTESALFKQISNTLQTDSVQQKNARFCNGEAELRFINPGHIRDKNVYLFHSFYPSSEENAETQMMHLLIWAKHASFYKAKRIKVLMLNYPHARQDRAAKSGEIPLAQFMGDLLRCAGVHEIITLDIHSKSISEHFWKSAIDHQNISSASIFAPFIAKKILGSEITDAIVAAPDQGALERANLFCAQLNQIIGSRNTQIEVALFNKKRLETNQIGEMSLIYGDVKGKDVLIVDDMIDTGGTLIRSIELLKTSGAKRVFALATYGIFSSQAKENLQESLIDHIYVADALQNEEQCPLKCERLPIAELLSEFIKKKEIENAYKN